MKDQQIPGAEALKFRKKPVVIEAVQINTEAEARLTAGICTGGESCNSKGAPDDAWPHVHTLEGDHTWSPGDWLITGVKGEQYFCKPDIFAMTYEPASVPASQPAAAPMQIGKIDTFSGKHGLTWSVDPESLQVGTLLYAGGLPTPSPADERASFSQWAREHRVADTEFHFEIWQASRAASANETGAEGARREVYPWNEREGRFVGSPVQAAEAVVIPAGWKLVPCVPTAEMVDAACPAGEAVDHFDMKLAILSAIKAAPQPPAPAAHPPQPVADDAAGEPVAWRTTEPIVCMPITEDGSVAEMWRDAGYDVIDLFEGKTRPTDDALWDQTLRERDNYHEWADKLANAIAAHLDVDIGEHSNINNPWREALESIENAVTDAEVRGDERSALQSIIDAGRSAKPKHLGGSGENTVYLTPAMYAALGRAAAAQAGATLTDDEILDEYAKHVHVTHACGVNVLSAMEPGGFVKAVRALLASHPTNQPEPRGEVTFETWLNSNPATWWDNVSPLQAAEAAFDFVRNAPRAEVTDSWQPIETAPAYQLVTVFWLDNEDEKNPERYDFDYIEDDCWVKWHDSYEWAHSVAPAGSRTPREQPPYTHWKPLGSPVIDAAHAGESR